MSGSKNRKDHLLGTIQAWTPDRLAANNRLIQIRQDELDEFAEKKEEAEKEKEKKDKEAGKTKAPKPHEVDAAKMVEDFVKEWSPQLGKFLETFCPTYRALPAFVILHILFWWSSPWYLHFVIPYPIIYLVPAWCTFLSLFEPNKENQRLWEAYWIILACIEYSESLVFGSTISLFWYPKIKALLCLFLYSTTSKEKRPKIDEKGRPVVGRDRRPEMETVGVYPALIWIKPVLPPVEKKEG
ncbi:hypothetical protein TREMEDRAFT_62719 [Tremella mesenterica DSM 1558]|uniref:uncharacterized protein n=1 Tax=Tremella mesenterica (strain ATCC 24925 / CBS 8224 / DSM 1558 / NBRC 9311 / NRRL Y-6157 / RJB 2259-6 / UBC 559-6) TaxID=578456 RepID=UPI0003F4A2CB|nr:uncharacterized protein TREMEDRAFT_62719 [Tremella mesenterica DSM 1558]EIW69002.1 hypothetical protein TREMEDRAFT_62719 [Tremella mesenterica DSM 1558]